MLQGKPVNSIKGYSQNFLGKKFRNVWNFRQIQPIKLLQNQIFCWTIDLNIKVHKTSEEYFGLNGSRRICEVRKDSGGGGHTWLDQTNISGGRVFFWAPPWTTPKNLTKSSKFPISYLLSQFVTKDLTSLTSPLEFVNNRDKWC